MKNHKMNIQFILIDPKKELCDHWQNAINALPSEMRQFKIHNGRLDTFKEKIDCFVSPANSYARLDGAYDAVLSDVFCPENDNAVTLYCQKFLHHFYQGYLHPGASFLIPMHEFNEKRYGATYIALTPTMKFPKRIINKEGVIYDCMWSLLSELYRHNKNTTNKIRTVCITGLGTGVGQYPVKTCALEMILAYRHFIESISKSWQEVTWEDIRGKQLDLDEILRQVEFLM